MRLPTIPSRRRSRPSRTRSAEHERQDYLTGYAEQLNCLDSLQPLYFHPWEDYDDSQRLKPGVIAKSGVQWNPRAEQNKVQAWSEFTPEDKH